MFSWKTKVFVCLISNHVVDNATDECDRGFSHPVGEKPGEALGGFLRVAGEIDSTKISLVRAGDKFDRGWIVEDGRESVGEGHREVGGAKAEGTSEQNRRDRETAKAEETFWRALNTPREPLGATIFPGP